MSTSLLINNVLPFVSNSHMKNYMTKDIHGYMIIGRDFADVYGISPSPCAVHNNGIRFRRPRVISRPLEQYEDDISDHWLFRLEKKTPTNSDFHDETLPNKVVVDKNAKEDQAEAVDEDDDISGHWLFQNEKKSATKIDSDEDDIEGHWLFQQKKTSNAYTRLQKVELEQMTKMIEEESTIDEDDIGDHWLFQLEKMPDTILEKPLSEIDRQAPVRMTKEEIIEDDDIECHWLFQGKTSATSGSFNETIPQKIVSETNARREEEMDDDDMEDHWLFSKH